MKPPQARYLRCCCLLLAVVSVRAGELPDVVNGPYPRAFFFRAAEGAGPSIKAGHRTYETWDAAFSRLSGIMGKSLEEEVLGRSENIPHFSRFKKDHPRQLVMLHYNGNARDPRDAVGIFSPEHWIYHNGCRVTRAVNAVAGETDLHVEDTTLFRMAMGRYRDKNEDIGICMLDENGHPNWRVSEQVELLGIDAKKKTLRVRRGCFGSKPRAFPAGKAYAAAHVTEGPWGQRNHIMWYYNYATNSPRDAAGRSCTDVLVEDLARLLAPGGKLEAFDGIEFDVLHGSCGQGGTGRRGPDINADGVADGGQCDGVNVYGAGVVEFCRRLRERVGDDVILTADGGTPRAQRAFGYLNGIESEGWPWLADWEIKDWSGGLNRHLYWSRHGRKPVFNFFNHKYTMAGPTPGSRRTPDVPLSTHRLVLATAQCVDAAVCYSTAPPKEKGERFGVWDELWKGEEKQLGWLGMPVAYTIHLAYAKPCVFGAAGRNMAPGFVRRVEGVGCTVKKDGPALHMTSSDGKESLHFRLRDVPVDGPDMVLRVNMRGAPMRGQPASVARIAWVKLLPPRGVLVTAEQPESGICLREQAESGPDPETGATVRFFARTLLDGEAHDAYHCHPPYKNKVRGYTFWKRPVSVPADGELRLFTGISELAETRSDGVTFRVLIQTGDGEWETVLDKHIKEWRWREHSVSLAKWGGKDAVLKFITDCGPKNNCTTDQAKWGDVTVLRKGAVPGEWQAQRFMTFVGSESFESSFYFRDLKGESVDFEFQIEGGGDAWLRDVIACPHPDLLIREFEHGLVLANPAHHPVTVDLEYLYHDRKFRRLRGRSKQDPKTNNGKRVGKTVTLGAVDGLFLVKEE